ncbi:MAG: hypothetical protein ABIP68_07455 [Ferruginibacter sp.]
MKIFDNLFDPSLKIKFKMKIFISAIIAISLSLPVLAQKIPPAKNKVPGKTDVSKKTSADVKKKEAVESDSTKLEIKMDKSLDIYFDSLNLTKKQIEQIAEIDEILNQKEGMSRAKIKMSAEEIERDEKENLDFKNKRIYDILTVKQVKEIYLLQNGKLKTGLNSDEIVNSMDLKPSQVEQINILKVKFSKNLDEISKIEDDIERNAAIQSLELDKEKAYKDILGKDLAEHFDLIKIGKMEIPSYQEKKDRDNKAAETKKKG